MHICGHLQGSKTALGMIYPRLNVLKTYIKKAHKIQEKFKMAERIFIWTLERNRNEILEGQIGTDGKDSFACYPRSTPKDQSKSNSEGVYIFT